MPAVAEPDLPLRFLLAVPLHGCTVGHRGDAIAIAWDAGAPAAVMLRPNLFGDVSLPLARCAAVELAVDCDQPLEVELRARGWGWLGSHRELSGRRLLAAGRGTLVLDTAAFTAAQDGPDADHLSLRWCAARAGTLTIRSLRLVEQSAAAFFAPQVDRFGQLAGSWPGKVQDELQLAAVEAPPAPPPGRDRWGGEGAPRWDATGRFTVHEDGGRWWLATPDGAPHLALGCCVANPIAATRVAGREHLFAALPPREGPAAAAWASQQARPGADPELDCAAGLGAAEGSVSFHVWNQVRAHGPEWLPRWRERTAARLRGWGFTGLGNWSDAGLACAAGLPRVLQADRVCRVDWGPCLDRSDGFPLHQTPDPYHGEFPERCRAAFAGCAAHRDDPLLLGWFVQNEEGWPWWRSPFHLPRAGAARRAFVDGLRQRYGGSIEALNRAWGARWRGWDHLAAFHARDNPPGLSAQGEADCDAFLGAFADRFWGAVAASLRAADPTHLFLGCRFLALPPHPALATALGRHADVVSVNWYMWYKQTMDDIAPFLDRWHALTGKPLLISEWAFELSDARGLAARVLCADPAERAAQSAAFAQRCLAHPAVVGMHWFQWLDEPCTGRDLADGERMGIGLVDVCDRPHRELVEALAAVNRAAYILHSA